MLAAEIIRHKRDGAVLDGDEIAFMVEGFADGSVSDAQAAAFAMAVFMRGMERAEVVNLTRAMTGSGTVLDWSDMDLPGPVLDKHSTGGIGDTVSLMLAPLVAACGGCVPMISGRGLGHTGGTLDKLDTIPGYNTSPDIAGFRRAVAEAGCAIIGQTADLAPADRRLYAIRDVTATVESVPLITASILSKKLAAGLGGLVMDVKTGSGAFAASIEMARELAASIATVAAGAGLPTTALITDMDQALGPSAGNALEVRETIDYLRGDRRDARLHQAVMAMASEMLVLGGLEADTGAARERLDDALDSGRAAERFARMVTVLGGPADLLEAADTHLPRAPVVEEALPERPGIVTAMDARAVGLVVVGLGGGRRRAEDAIDPAVGLSEIVRLGETVDAGRPLALVHAADRGAAREAGAGLRAAITVGGEAPPTRPLVLDRLSYSAP